MTTDQSYVVRISARYADDHQETSTLPGTELGRNGRGVELELTIGQLVELVSRADYYADPHYGRELADSGYADLHRSAKKACEQIRRAGLWELARSKEANDAYSREWDAAMSAPRY
jgi:hypothetical protein